MRILHVIHSVDPRGGGPIEGIRQLIPALASQGIDSEVMSLDAPGAPGTGDFPVPLHLTGIRATGYGYSGVTVPWLRAHRARFDAMIVNGLWQYGGLAVWRALRGTSTPYYVYTHGMLDPWFKRTYPLKHLKKWLYWPWAEYRILRDAAAVLFTSEEEKLEARKSFWLYRCREVVTGYGISAPAGDAERQCDRFLEQYSHLRDQRLILFLGRMHVKKGCDLLLKAWREISQSGRAMENLHLVMAGPVDHAYGEEMKTLAGRLGLGDSVTWTGMLAGDLKWGSLQAAEAFVLPSHQENFGISVVEALACGVPVLISDKVNIWREIGAEEAGFVASDDLPGTIGLLGRWLDLGEGERERMRARAGECFRRRFDVAVVAESLGAVLRGRKVGVVFESVGFSLPGKRRA